MSRICLGLLVILTLLIAGCGGYGSNNMGGGAGAPSITSLNPNMKNANDPAFTLTGRNSAVPVAGLRGLGPMSLGTDCCSRRFSAG